MYDVQKSEEGIETGRRIQNQPFHTILTLFYMSKGVVTLSKSTIIKSIFYTRSGQHNYLREPHVLMQYYNTKSQII